MKPWARQQVPSTKSVDVKDPVIPVVNLPVSSDLIWDCVDCESRATVMYEGTTFCRGCLDVFLRRNYKK